MMGVPYSVVAGNSKVSVYRLRVPKHGRTDAWRVSASSQYLVVKFSTESTPTQRKFSVLCGRSKGMVFVVKPLDK